jgi:hypothetical protein
MIMKRSSYPLRLIKGNSAFVRDPKFASAATDTHKQGETKVFEFRQGYGIKY